MHEETSFLEDFRKNWQSRIDSETKIDLRTLATQCLKHEFPCDAMKKGMDIAYEFSDLNLNEICSKMLAQK